MGKVIPLSAKIFILYLFLAPVVATIDVGYNLKFPMATDVFMVGLGAFYVYFWRKSRPIRVETLEERVK